MSERSYTLPNGDVIQANRYDPFQFAASDMQWICEELLCLEERISKMMKYYKELESRFAGKVTMIRADEEHGSIKSDDLLDVEIRES